MSPFAASIVVATALLGQAAAGDSEAVLEQRIRATVQQLRAKDYSTREQASRQLWRYGLAAEAALKHAAKSRDGETRLRAKRLLRDFEYGLVPGTDADTQRLIRDFRDGGRDARSAAFERLVEQQQGEILERLIRLEADAQVRRLLLSAMFQDARIVDRYLQRDRIEALVETVGADQDAQWKRSVTIQLMFAPRSLARLAQIGSLDKLLRLIRDETDVAARQSMLVAIFRSPGIGVVLSLNELGFALDALRAEPDKTFRGGLLGEVFANSQAAQAIVAHRQLDAILEFSREQTDAASQQKLIEIIVTSGPVVESLLKDGGVEAVVALVSKEIDPVRRGRLLGATISSSAIRTFLQRNGLSQLAIKLAKDETNLAARHEFLQALLHDTTFIYSLNNEETVASLWQLIKADDNAEWRAQSLVVLLQSHRAGALLKDQGEAAWILKLAGDGGAGPIREDILRFLLPDGQAQRVLIAGGHFDTMLKLARELPLRARGEILGNFLAGSSVAQHLVATKQIELLIGIAKDEPDATVRHLCLQGIFRNSGAMSALLSAGHYATFRDLIQLDEDPARRASLFGAFIADYRVLQELDKRGDTALLLETAESSDEGAQRQFLPRLFRNQRAVGLLMDQGHFPRLLALARQDGGTNFDEFLAIPKVIEHLAATKQFAVFLDFAADEADDNTRRSLLRNVFYNTKTIEALLASKNFDQLLRLIRAERDATWRASLLGPVISSTPVVAHFAAAKQLDVLLSMISNEPEPIVRARLMMYLTLRADALSLFIDRGKLDALIELVNTHSQGQVRGNALAAIVTNGKALEHLKANQRVGLLLSFTDDADSDFTTAYVLRLFAAAQATDLLVEQGYYRELFKIATTREAKVRAALIGRLLGSEKSIEQMIARGDVATLVSLVKSEADNDTRRNCLTVICGNDRLVEEMLKGDSFDALLATLRAEQDVPTRNRQLATLVYSAKAIARLSADEQLEGILAAALADSDANIRASWLTNVFQRASSFEALVKLGYGEQLLDALEREVPVGTQQSLLRAVFSNNNSLGALIENGHLERLLETAKRLGGSQLGALLRSPVVIEHCVATKQLPLIFAAAEKQLDANAKVGVIYALVQNEKIRKSVLEAGQFESLCALIQGVPDENQQASLFTAAFSSMDVWRHYVDTKTLDRLLAYLEKTATPAAASRILLYVSSRREILDLLIDQGHWETLLRIGKDRTEGEAREQLLAQLLTSPKALAKLVADEKVESLLSYATGDDGSVSVTFVRHLLANYRAVGLLIDRGRFADLLKLATFSDDAATRASLLGPLLMNAQAIDQLSVSGQLSLVVNYAKDEQDLRTRRTFLGVVCGNQLLLAELVRVELFDGLVEACDGEQDPVERRRQFAALLQCESAIDKFATGKRLESLIENVLAEHDKSRRQSWLTSLLLRANAFAALVRHGFGDQLIAAAERELDAARLPDALGASLSNPAVVSAFATSGQHRLLFKILAAQPRDDRRLGLLFRIVANEDAMQALARDGELDQLLERVAELPKQTDRENLKRQIFASFGTVSAFARQEKLPELFELIRGIEDEALRRSCLQMFVYNDRTRQFLAELTDAHAFVSLVAEENEPFRSGVTLRLVSDANLRRRWVDAGQVAELKKLIETSTNEAFREQHLHNLYYTPAGVLGNLLRQEKFDDAAALLRKGGGDRAMSWLAAYHTSRGQLGVEIERLREQKADSRGDDESRLLAYLLRANGDLAEATNVADTLRDPRLLRPLLVERRMWSAAAALQAEAPLEPPVELPLADQQDDNTRRIEQLGMLASYHRLAGDEASAGSAIAEILALVEANQADLQLAWHAAQALLLNDCVDEGLRLTRASRPVVAFRLFASRHDYASAFATVGCDEDFVADRLWYDALPFGTAQGDIQQRLLFAIDVARTLQQTGRAEAGESVFSLLETIIAESPKQGAWPTQDYLRRWYSGGLYRVGLKPQAFSAAAMTIDTRHTSPPAVLQDIFGSRQAEAHVWWQVLQSQSSEETPELRLARVDAVLNPPTAEALQSFPELVSQAIEFAGAGQNETFWQGLADTCIALGQQERAIECYERIDDKSLGTSVAYAHLLFAAQRWADAAQHYHDAWQHDYDRLALLFLAGVAKQRAGDATQGEAWQRLADLQAVTPQLRHQLALALAQRGLADAAHAQWQVLLRTAPFESLELNDAARQLALSAYLDEPALAAPLWQHYLLGDVRPAFWLLNAASYLQVPALLHKIRAIEAIERSDFEAAEREMRLGVALCPGDTVIAEEVVPRLDAAGQREIADRFVAQVVDHYEGVCEAHPNFAQLHNNLAWATARCHRRLDEALLHAQRAVELEPDNAGYIDTLAEVYFHLGDRDAAIQWSKRAVALRPLGKSLQTQLARFRAAPLPAP